MNVSADAFVGTVVVDDLLHEGGVVVFRARLGSPSGSESPSHVSHERDSVPAAGTARGEPSRSVRCIALRVLMRPPAAGETWEIDGEWQAHPECQRRLKLHTFGDRNCTRSGGDPQRAAAS
jgi:hypothetical protein